MSDTMQNFTFDLMTFGNQTQFDETYRKTVQAGYNNATSQVGFFIDALFIGMMITFILRRLPIINENRRWFSDAWMKRFEYLEGNAYTFSVAASYTLFLMRHALF